MQDGRTESRRRRLVAGAWIVAVASVACAVIGSYVHAYSKVGPIEETQHLDYVLQLRDGDFPRDGDLIGSRAMRIEACRGLESGVPSPSCEERDPSATAYAFSGVNTVAESPPLYYGLSAAAGWFVGLLPGVSDELTATRLVGALWLATGLVLVVLTARRLGARAWSIAPVVVLVATTPAILHASSSVHPDAAALAAGGGMAWLLVRWFDSTASRSRLGALVAWGSVIVLLRPVFVLAVIVAVAAMLFQAAWAKRGRERWQVAGQAALVGASSVVVLGAWRAIVALRATNSSPDVIEAGRRAAALDSELLIAQVMPSVLPITAPHLPAFFTYPWAVWSVIIPLSTMLVAATFGTVLYGGSRRTTTVLAFATSVALGLAGLLVALFQKVVFGEFAPVSSATSLVLVPFASVILARGLTRSRGLTVLTVGLSAASVFVVGDALGWWLR